MAHLCPLTGKGGGERGRPLGVTKEGRRVEERKRDGHARRRVVIRPLQMNAISRRPIVRSVPAVEYFRSAAVAQLSRTGLPHHVLPKISSSASEPRRPVPSGMVRRRAAFQREVRSRQ